MNIKWTTEIGLSVLDTQFNHSHRATKQNEIDNVLIVWETNGEVHMRFDNGDTAINVKKSWFIVVN